jgi:hypothetical protein
LGGRKMQNFDEHQVKVFNQIYYLLQIEKRSMTVEQRFDLQRLLTEALRFDGLCDVDKNNFSFHFSSLEKDVVEIFSHLKYRMYCLTTSMQVKLDGMYKLLNSTGDINEGENNTEKPME